MLVLTVQSWGGRCQVPGCASRPRAADRWRAGGGGDRLSRLPPLVCSRNRHLASSRARETRRLGSNEVQRTARSIPRNGVIDLEGGRREGLAAASRLMHGTTPPPNSRPGPLDRIDRNRWTIDGCLSSDWVVVGARAFVGVGCSSLTTTHRSI